MATKVSFLKNNIFVFSNRIFSKLITFGLLLYLARSLDAGKFGELTILISLASVFALIMDLGTSFIVVRETASKNLESQKILFSTLAVKVIAGFFCFWGVSISLRLLKYPTDTINLSYIYSFGLIWESLLLTLVKHFEGEEKMKYSSILIVSERILIACFLYIISLSHNLLFSYGAAYIISNFTTFTIGFLFFFRKKNEIQILDLSLAGKILKFSYPFIIFNIFSIIYYKLDIFVIAYFYNQIEVGVYKASFQIINSIYFISLSISISLLPFFSRKRKEERSNIDKKYSQILKKLILFGLFITITIIPNSTFILSTLYKTKYLAGNLTFILLSITIPLYFAANIMGNLLIAIGKEKIQISSMVISTIVKLLCLLFFVKMFGILGAALAAIMGDLIAFLIHYKGTTKNGFLISINSRDSKKILILILYFILQLIFNNIVFSFVIMLPVFIYLFWDIFKVIKENIKTLQA